LDGAELHLRFLRAANFDEEIAVAALEQAASAVERWLLARAADELHQQAEKRIREVSTIYEIGRAIDSVENDRLLEIITAKAASVMEAQACSLMRLNPETRALTIAASHGLSEDVVFMTHRALGEGIAGRVAATGKPMLIADTQQDPRLSGVHLRPEIGSSMLVPLKDEHGGVTGVLSIRRRRPAPDFTESDLKLFSVFASQAGLAINNKQLYDDLHRHVKELSTLSDLTLAVISHLDLNSLLETVAHNIVDVVKFDRCCIFLYDRTQRRFFPHTRLGYRSDVIGRTSVKKAESVVGVVATKQMPIVENDARSAIQPIRGFARALGTNSFVAIPIVTKGQTIGVVVADNKLSGRHIQPAAVELLTTFVNQAGIALENARLNEERQQRFDEMNRLATQTDDIFRSIGLAAVVIDGSGRVARLNGAAQHVWGVEEVEVKGSTYHRLIDRLNMPPAETEMMQQRVAQVRESGSSLQEYKVVLHPRRRGELIVNFLISPLLDRAGEQEGVVLLLEDVTRLMAMETEISRIRRLADIGQLAAKLAHEVRNPLSSIKGAAQLLRNEQEEKGPFREFLDIIIDEVNHLSKITTDLLDFARPMHMELTWTNLNDLAARTLFFAGPMLEENGVTVRFRPDEELPDNYGDAKQIEQVMRNIAINAAQAMPEGGTLAVTTRFDPASETVSIRFKDSGRGIPTDLMGSIFQPFVTSKTKGTGLGLSIVKRIVESHQGRIEVQSRPGQGALFVVQFPLRPEPVETPTGLREEEGVMAGTLPDV
jgi:PAS domain S-box-containing protein